MNKNPIYNALSATGYIIFVVFLINLIDKTEVNIGAAQYIMPIMMISLFTLSAAVMGYLFCYQPLILILEKKKEEAIKLFIKSIAYFGLITLVIFLIYSLFFYNIAIFK